MKNQITNHKSKIIHLIAACVILAAFAPRAAEPSPAQGQGRGGPPSDISQTFIFPGICGFDVQLSGTGRSSVISLPSGGLIITAPDVYGTFTNLSDPSKSVTLNLTGAFHISFDQNGDTIYMLTGRNQVVDPSFGLLLLVGDFTLMYDSNGNLVQGRRATDRSRASAT